MRKRFDRTRGDEAEREAHKLINQVALDVGTQEQPSLFLQETRTFLRDAQARIDAMRPPWHETDAAHARTTDRETSHDAALAATIGLREKQQAVYECLRLFGPLADCEMIARYARCRDELEWDGWPQQSDSGLRTRRHELTERTHALVVNDGVTKIGARNHTIWRAVE